MDSNTVSQFEDSIRLTSDGFSLSPDYSLRFTPFSWQYLGWGGTVFCLAIEWQQEGRKRRPYLIINVGPLHIQAGWLWVSSVEAELKGKS